MIMKLKTFLLPASALFALTLTACTSIATFDYDAAPGTLIKFPETKAENKKSITVLPFADQRGMNYLGSNASYHAGDNGSLYFGLIPLFPFGFTGKEEPENSKDFVSLGRFHFDPVNDLTDAAYISIANSGLFSETDRAASLKDADTDYIWQGAIRSTRYEGYLLTYGVTYFLSPALWIVGCPSGVSYNRLDLEFTLLERETGKPLWKFTVNSEDSITHWIYARVGQDASVYAKLMKRAMNEALNDLSRKLPNY